MSRHRNVRNMDYDDYDDGYDEYPSPSSSYDGSNFGSYPQSPSMASYLYNRQANQQGMGFSPKHSSPLSTGGSPSKAASGDERVRKDSDSEGALLFDMESSGAKGRSSAAGDGDLVKECSNRVLKIVGIGVFTKKEIEDAIRKHDYDSEAAAEALRQEKVSLDLAKKMRSEAPVASVVPATSDTKVPPSETAPAALSFLLPSNSGECGSPPSPIHTSTRRPRAPHASTSRPSHPSSSSGVRTVTAPTKANAPPEKTSQAQGGASAPDVNRSAPVLAKPSGLAEALCQKTQTPKEESAQQELLRKFGSLSLQGGMSQVRSGIVPFTFDTPSPDDEVLSKREHMIRNKGHSNPAPRAGAGGIQLVAHPDGGKPITKPGIPDRPATAPVAATTSAKNTPKSSPRASPTPDSSSRTKKAPPQRSAAATNSLLASLQSNTGGDKPRISLVVVGHVDAGKSTLMGHMMYLKGKVSQKVMHKYEKETKEKGKGSFHFAWVLDEHEEERSRGVTMDVGVTYFETNQRKVTLLDAPGHKDFIPAMISGAAQADVAILVVDSATGEFEAGFDHDGQTKEHTMLIRSLGITQVAVAVNKLDMTGWSQDRFNEIVGKLRPFLKQTGFKESNIRYVPVSGLEGENLMKRNNADLSAWYSGPTLHDVIDTFGPSERPVDKPFRLCVADVFKSMSLGLTIGGKIESGVLAPGDKVAVVPGNEFAVVKGVERDGEQVKVAVAGENVEVGLTGLEMFMVGVGNVLCDPENTVPVVSKFEAQIVTFNITMPVVKGAQVVLHTQSINEPAVIKKLIGVMDKSSGEIAKKRPRCLTKNMTAVVEIHVSRPVCLDLYSEIKNLGRFMLREDGRSIAAGIVSKIIK